MITYVVVRFGHYAADIIQPAVHVTNSEANASAWLGDKAGQIFQFDGSKPLNLSFIVRENVITRVN